MAIKGVHAMFFSDRPEETRAFLRDKMQIPCFDSGGGWLIFHELEADMGVHPLSAEGKPKSGTHDISFYCEDLEAEVAGMKDRGVEFATGVEDQGFGLVTSLVLPGDIRVQLYQPKYK